VASSCPHSLALSVRPRYNKFVTRTFEGANGERDVVAVLPDRETALALGRRYNQIAIYDLAAGEEIEAGGTGEAVLVEILPEQRLPKLER
jgi:hypothetical protein